MAAAPPQTDPDLQHASWDLEPLVSGEGEEGVRRRMTEALERSKAFAERHAGKLEELDSAGLAAAMGELADVQELVGRAGYYAALRFSTDTADPANGALMQWVQEQETAIQTTLLFFELEWAALPEERAEELLSGPGLDYVRHHLRNVRRYREHLLSEPEERIVTEKSLTGASAWKRLFEELTSVIEVELAPAEEGAEPPRVPLDVALSRLQDADREVRRTSAEGVTAALAPGLRTRAFLFNTLLADKATEDRLRRYDSWLAARNLANEASDESVQALISAVRSRYEIPRRWYRLKARLLGARAARRLRPHGVGQRGRRGDVLLQGGEGDRARLLLGLLARARHARLPLLPGAPHRRARAPGQAGRARSAPEPCPRSSPTCCSTTPRAGATSSRSPTSSATECTSRSRPGRASSSSTRR